MKSTNYSVKQVLEIADKYGYKLSVQVIHSFRGDKFYLYAQNPFLKSPYPRLISSYAFGVKKYEELERNEII